jgi:secreted trypsin-like serine protease
VHFPDRMQQAKVPVVSPAECRTAYATADLPIDATMICAGRTNLDTCQGDSGGPMFVKAVGSPGFIQSASPASASAAARPGSLTSTPT